MATLKDVQTKIGAVKKTKQITRAMNMVATSKLRGAQQKMEAFRPYAVKFAEVLGSLSEKSEEGANPLLIARAVVKRIHVVLCTSDRGLCGGFNANLITAAERFVQEKSAGGIEFSFTCFGKKGHQWCRKKGLPIAAAHPGIVGSKFGFSVAIRTGTRIVDDFLGNRLDEVYLIYAEFLGMSRQAPAAKQLLPIPSIEKADAPSAGADTPYLPEHLCEPSASELLEEMLPRSVYAQVFRALLETSTSEHAARMTAMDNATRACSDMIESLSLLYNKARQAAITADLMDIVGGAEALKG